MQLDDVIDGQPEHSSIVYERGDLMLQRTVLVEEASLRAAFDRVPWSRLVFLKCDRQSGGKRLLLYRWRAEADGWTPAM